MATSDGQKHDQHDRQRQDVARSSPGPPSGDGEEIDTPRRPRHRGLKVSHVVVRGAHVARAGPRFPSEMLADNIEQCPAIGGLQTTIGCHVGIAGVATSPKPMVCYLTSAIRVWPTMTSGIPLVNSRTLFLTQFAAFSFEANASSALSNLLIVISTSGPPSSR
jgi:hypothetical protein